MPGATVDVILLDVPVPLWAKARERLERSLAELATDEGAPARMAALRRRLRADYAFVAETADAEATSAAARRLATVDVAYPVPVRARADVDAFATSLRELDAYARERGREDLAMPADCANFWGWYLGEIAKQLDGGFPAPWPGD